MLPIDVDWRCAIRLQGWDAMRVLITGVSGQLGYYLAQACEKAGAESIRHSAAASRCTPDWRDREGASVRARRGW